jgi:CRISPR-associated protein Cas2
MTQHQPSYKRYWISYDISSDTRRNQLSQLLTGWGVRVQLSVFECVLNPREIKQIQRQIQRIVKAREGEVVILQCAAPGRPSHPKLGRPHDIQRNYWLG